ncbi:glomulin-like isoform X1 [Brachionus plicatilis]|uniref:Glomulin-like isoform X1 n=1 Tax=Brachionus plicatilis TaxID=10195 RepID=A0A3M7T4H4_BRAPC|nr:glomulin-like isoform X1 [Brachionus plicatilis]
MEVYGTLEKALEQNDIKNFQTIYSNPENENFKFEFSWDLALLFSTYINKYSTENRNESVDFLKKINQHLCELYANPKEIYLVYLENSELLLKSGNFDHFIDLMQTIFLKSNIKFLTSSLQSIFSLFNKHLSQIPSSTYQTLVELVLTFLTTLVQRFNESVQLKEMMTTFLIELFKHVYKNDLLDPKKELIIDKTIDFVKKINKNLFILIIKFEERKSEFDKTALSLFTSYILVKQSKLDYDYLNFPKVYQNIFIFCEILKTLNRLFNDLNNELFVNSGLLATKLLTERLDEKALTEEYLELGPLVEHFESLFRTSVHAQFESSRKLSNQILKAEFNLFTRTARFYFIKYFYNFYSKGFESLNIYVLSYLMYLLKEEVNQSINLNEDFYMSKKSNLKKIFALALGSKKLDVVKESSLVISLLSLIRLILLKDKTDKTGIHSQLKSQVTGFVHFIESCCEENQTFYSVELKKLAQESEKCAEIKKTIKINHEVTSEPTKKEQIQSTEASLQTINLIKSLNIRIEELYEEFRNK